MLKSLKTSMRSLFLTFLLVTSPTWGLTLQETLAPEVFLADPQPFIQALAVATDIEGPGPRSYLLQLLSFEELSDPLTDHHKALDALLAHDVCLRTQDAETGDTPLTVALEARQSPEILKKLILHGASIDTARDDGLTPIQIAVNTADLDVIRVLVDRGARLDVYEVYDDFTSTLLDSLDKSNPEAHDCMDYLAAQGAKRSSATTQEEQLLQAAFFAARSGNLRALELIDRDVYLSDYDRDGRTIFHHAAIGQSAAVMAFLAPLPEDLAEADNCGKTPGDLALHFARDERSPYAKMHPKLSLPVLTGPQLAADYIGALRPSEFTWTEPLWNAARYNDAKSLEALCQTRRNALGMTDSSGRCLLSYASNLSLSTIRTLLEAGAKLPRASELLTLSVRTLRDDFYNYQHVRKLALFQAYGLVFQPADLAAYRRSLADYEILRLAALGRPRPLETPSSLSLPDDEMATLCQQGDFAKANATITAAAKGDSKIVKALFNYRLSLILVPGSDGNYTTALITALAAGHKDIATYLLENNADPTLLSQNKQTALGCAIDLQDANLIKQVLDGLTPIDIVPSASTRLGKTLHPLVQAAYLHDSATIEMLFDLGMAPSILFPYMGGIITSAASQNVGFLTYLLSNGVDCNSQDENGTSALLAAIQARQQAAIDLLLARPELLVDLSDNTGFSPLMAAALQDNSALITQLAAKGAVLELVNADKQGALELALRAGKKAAIQALLTAGVKLNTVNQSGATPLAVAASCRDSTAIIAMLDKGALVNSTDSAGNTALHLAVLAGDEDIATLLLQRGANCLKPNTAGKSALVYARDLKQDKLVALMCSLTEPTFAEWLQSLMQVAIGFVLLILATLFFYEGKKKLFTQRLAKWGRELGKSTPLTVISSVLLAAFSGTHAATVSVATWLFESDLLNLRRYILACSFAELGACAILFLVGQPLVWPIGLCLGLFGLLYVQEKPVFLVPYLAYPCALGLTLLGVSSIDTTLTNLAGTPTIISATALTHTWTIAGAVVGFFAGLIFQSLVGMQLGLLTLAYVNNSALTGLFAVYVGAVIAGGLRPFYTITPFSAKTSFIAPLHTRHAFVWGGLLLADILLERYAGIPLLMAASSALFVTRWQQLLALFLLSPIVKAIYALVALRRLEFFAETRRLPKDLRACLQPHFLDPYYKKDDATVLHNLEQEQAALLNRIEKYPTTLTHTGLLDEHHSAFKGVHRAMVTALRGLRVADERLNILVHKQKRIDIYERLVYRFGARLGTIANVELRAKLEQIFTLLCQNSREKEALAKELSALQQETNPEAAEPAAFLEALLKVARSI